METIVTVVKATAALPVGNPEYAVHGADCSTNACTDCFANDTADRARHPVTFVSTLLSAAHDALGVPDLGNRQQGKSEGRARQVKLRRRAAREGRPLGPIHRHL